ncbi:hypothetical protein TruAng_001875 [Truncatella angustata]|nr:hypothetical protein TruAng_001875 [Truncatella angustata]
MLTTSLTLLTACLALPEIAHAGFILGSQSNIAVYYGQNSLGKKGSQQRLSAYCSDSKFNIIPLAFMNGISTPITNFANAGDNCTVYSGTQLLNCPQLEQDIILCQNTYQKTIILSLGGATYSEGGFSSPTAAQTAAANVWDLFGPNNGAANRPFGSAVVDGFDFDFEASTQNAAPFAQKLRDLMDAAHNKKYYLTAAPQCPYPDLAQEEILLNVKLDFVMVQFYNNYCGALSFDTDVVTQDNFNMERWDTWARSTSKNDKVKILLGVPANTGAGAGYLSATELTPVINYCKQFSSFGGVMMWDMSQMGRRLRLNHNSSRVFILNNRELRVSGYVYNETNNHDNNYQSTWRFNVDNHLEVDRLYQLAGTAKHVTRHFRNILHDVCTYSTDKYEYSEDVDHTSHINYLKCIHEDDGNVCFASIRRGYSRNGQPVAAMRWQGIHWADTMQGSIQVCICQ